MADDKPDRSRGESPAHRDAHAVEGRTHTGRTCRIVDNTGEVDRAELAALLEDLVRARRFGLLGMSAGADARIPLAAPVGSHVQIGGRLYRLLLFPYEARIERF